ncbi:MAG: MBOAT family protein [Clostridia bacterium]|nr:MBOAT family protein [Clostridia bacterium]
MAYVSLEFLGFLIPVLLLYYLIPRRFQWAVLLAASYAFYLLNGIPQIAFIVFTTAVTYAAGLIMQKTRDENKVKLQDPEHPLSKEEKKELKKRMSAKIHLVQTIALLVDLLVLIVVKYVPFLAQISNSLLNALHISFQFPAFSILVPLGISFYTFMSIGYLIDVGKGKYDAERHFGRFALFISFFPSIVQGPINHFDVVGVQFREGHKLEYKNLKYGAQLMLWGFFMKLVISDRVAPMVAKVFSADYAGYSGTALFLGVLAYAIQIYGDFAGGINIVIGAAQMFGIQMPKNFTQPYFAESMTDYWRRWHITLGDFMREYVFFPVMLSKPVNRISKFFRSKFGPGATKLVPSIAAPFVVFMLMGIWHGASWQWIVYGLYNAIVIAGGVALTPLFDKLTARIPRYQTAFSWKLFRIIRTFLLTCVAKVITQSPGLGAAFAILKKILTNVDLNLLVINNGKLFELGISPRSMLILLAALLVLFVVDLLKERGVQIRDRISEQPLVFRWMLYIAVISVIVIFGCYGAGYDASAFIYQEF